MNKKRELEIQKKNIQSRQRYHRNKWIYYDIQLNKIKQELYTAE